MTVEACLTAIRAGDHWHNNLVRLTGHWIARGWSDDEILTATEALTLPGYSIDQTRREDLALLQADYNRFNRDKIQIPFPQHDVYIKESV